MLKIASHITISTETKILHTVSGMGGAAQCQEWVVLHSVRNGWCCTLSGMGAAAPVAVVLNAGKATQINVVVFFFKDKEKVLCG